MDKVSKKNQMIKNKINILKGKFNQDFDENEGTRSPGWIRYQKRIK